MVKVCFMSILFLLLGGCFAYVENNEGVSHIKSVGMTDDEALDLLDKAEAKSPDEKHEILFFRGH